MRYGTDFLQLMMEALPTGARVLALDVHAYGGSGPGSGGGSSRDMSLATFSDQQRHLGTVEMELKPVRVHICVPEVVARIKELVLKNGGLEDDEEVAVSTTVGVGFSPEVSAPDGNYFLPVLDMVVSKSDFKDRMTGPLMAKAIDGKQDPMLEFLREYRFTALDTDRSLHLVGAQMVENTDGLAGYTRAQPEFLAQALMFPSLGADSAWIGHSLYRQWMGLRISANAHAQVPTINPELTRILRLLDRPDQQAHMGQANPEGIETVTF